MATVSKQPRKESETLQDAVLLSHLRTSTSNLNDDDTFIKLTVNTKVYNSTLNHEQTDPTPQSQPIIASAQDDCHLDDSRYDFQPLVEPDDTEFKMDNKNRGRCIIFSHDTFSDRRIPGKAHAREDGEKCSKYFQNLNFRTENHVNFNLTDIQKTLTEVTLGEDNEEYMRNSDCLVVVLLTHEAANGHFWASDQTYCINMLWTQLLAGDKAEALSGKPLVFILDATLHVEEKEGDTWDTWGVDMSRRDLLLIHSTVGEETDNNDEKGSLFMKHFCNELGEKRPEDLFSTLSAVNKSIANSKNFDQSKYLPRTLSTFSKKLYFGGKPEPLEDKHQPLGYDVMDVYNLAKALKTYLEIKDKELDVETVDDGDAILNLMCEWERLDRDGKEFARQRLSTFCTELRIIV